MEDAWLPSAISASTSSFKGPEGEEKAAAIPSVSSSVPLSIVRARFKYDVFLSFTGRLHGFPLSLYQNLKDAGLRIYIDDNDGSGIFLDDHEPMEAMEKSWLSMPIFSEDYTSCESFLNRVAEMYNCWSTKGHLILPVFYHIDGSHFENQTFLQHWEKGVDPQVIKKWRMALQGIASREGDRVSLGDQAKDVKIIVSRITGLLKTYEEVSVGLFDDNLVAIEQPVQDVFEMLQISSRDVRTVGICGIPGIGKTTLAKVLYRQLLPEFEHRFFISNIQERSEKEGLSFLQKELIEGLRLNSYKKFTKKISHGMKVLIVLDDVGCLDHIKAFDADLRFFGGGSRIILTTRKPQLLVEAKVCHRYFVEELDELHSLKLFYGYAFEKDSPEGEYSHLSAEIASSSKGIPRVIQSVGTYLSKYTNKEKEKWEEVLQRLRSLQYKPLQESLKISNDDLSKGRWRFWHDRAWLFPISNDIRHFDVVLSFDARDKVKNLVESLHKRMESFQIGDFALNGDSMQVNTTGKIFIPVISKSYASNSLCLEMLAHMVECRRSSAANHILPIFYAIEPSSNDKLQTFLYESYSRLSLPETFTKEEFHNLINSVCQMVLDKLKLNQKLENRLVGIDAHVESILKLLNPEVNDVRSIAIRGRDGTGKTTLAKTLYHQLSSSFEGCSFLSEIDERTQHRDGIKYLQAKLISDLLDKRCEVFASVIEGISLIKRRFQHMKVLIILDDVAESSHVKDLVGQLDWFGPGSRIIITANVAIEIPIPHSNYAILQTSIYWSDILFRMHAFRKVRPLSDFELLYWEIAYRLSSFDNPCLALEIVGSLLYGKGEDDWFNMVEISKDKDLKRILRMSYDRLDEMQKKIFLDIACIPIELDRRIASYLWYNYFHSSAFADIEALILLSLVKVDANNEIWMHRVVRDFGKEIADPGETEREHVGLEFPASPRFERMDNIRFLKLDPANINGSTDCVSMRQRDFIWQCSPDLLAKHHFKCLEVLDMSWSMITEDWEGWDKIKVPKLRVLNLTGCSKLMLTPNFSFCPNLEMLILEHCSRLVKIDPSIGKLQRLTTLNLRYCLELSVLPKEVGCLTALRELPLDGTSLQEIPFSIGHLENLHFLTAINCFSLSHSSDSTHELLPITISKPDVANITELPFFIGEKMNLGHLSLRGCRSIKTLPALVGAVESSLVELDVSETSISELPESIIKLKVLKVLKMNFCFITEFPQGFGELKRLEEIHASWCRNLEQLPNDIGELKSLRILMLRNTRISNVPESIQYLECLHNLDCSSCNKLQNLPKLPSSLTSLHVESKKLKELPDYAYFTRLKELTLVVGDFRDSPDISVAAKPTTREKDPLHWLQPCSSLGTLRLCLPPITDLPGFPPSLKILRIFRCKKLEHLPPLPSTVVVLSVQDCMSLVEMPNVKNLENLQEMEIMDCPKIEIIRGLERLQAMRVLTISGSGIRSLKGLDKLTSLSRLTVCRSMRDFLNLSTLNCVNVQWL